MVEARLLKVQFVFHTGLQKCANILHDCKRKLR